ncbi:hypothetical protein G6011_02521 [Alternaria panax]|uniref:Uncharacterized protein n=1 Tax=Alternaria panax TaxID=48097 RepID=A0AAD4F9S7_9PLEO|nr:hypothetical protein G6011_02521 [Alternaria panax]
MSWSDDSNSGYADSWAHDESDYGYHDWDNIWHAYEEIFPLEFLPFRNLCEIATGFLDTQKGYPLYDAAMIEFIAIAEAGVGATAWIYELKFHRFLELSPELRLEVYVHGLENARRDGTLAKQLHVDRFSNPCCIWRWPGELIVCDRHSEDELPTARFAPWLPDIAFASKQVLGEVTICMLSTTEWFDFKYEEHKPFKIVRWFTDFLVTFPTIMVNDMATTEAFASIKRICFPHESKYNERRVGRVVDEKNPDITLMLKCTKLETIAMVFNYRQLIGGHWAGDPRDLDDFLDFFHFGPMLEHKSIQNVYLEGVYPRYGEGRTMVCLYEFGKWLVKGFRKRSREVNVHVYTRRGPFMGRHVGPKLVVDEEVAKVVQR